MVEDMKIAQGLQFINFVTQCFLCPGNYTANLQETFRIPDRLIQKFGDELSSIGKLTIPSGRAWNSNFNVHIFDLATSEIKYPLDTCSRLEEPSHVKQCPLEEHIEDINSVEILASSPSCPTPSSSINKAFYESICYSWNNNSKFGISSENLHPVENMCHLEATSHSTRDVGTQLNYSELTAVDEVDLHFGGVTGGQLTRSGQRTDPCVHESLGKQKVEAELHDRKLSLKASMKNWRAVTTVKKWKTVCAAELFKSDHPFFRVTLRQYNTRKGFVYLHVPATFARKYLNGFRGHITLLDSDCNRQWLVQSRSKDGRVDLYKGWSKYARDNNLEEGDVCVFEPIRTKDVALKVTIFRALEHTESISRPN
ncbi:hypothetical protein Pint_34508 [Pistacia integerrima]|uniref:Uncharacterized protein n=1 Tax=Pistacia integerrima TaxID=434235 RepID=A0ACC0X7C2_9ROSI|nr:hypothetical protein Pint_34508 [Pistacia integerrima]